MKIAKYLMHKRYNFSRLACSYVNLVAICAILVTPMTSFAKDRLEQIEWWSTFYSGSFYNATFPMAFAGCGTQPMVAKSRALLNASKGRKTKVIHSVESNNKLAINARTSMLAENYSVVMSHKVTEKLHCMMIAVNDTKTESKR